MTKIIAAIALVAGVLIGAPAAQADVDVGISIGVPGIFWGGPAYYPPPPRYYYPPRVVVVPERVYGPGYGYYRSWGDRGHYAARGDRRWGPRDYRGYRGPRGHGHRR